jgi:hypothetical protein
MKLTIIELKRNFNIIADEYNEIIIELAQEKRRLDYILNSSAFIQKSKSDSGGEAFQLLTQNEDEEYIFLHNPDLFFKTERDAIDAYIGSMVKEN